MQRAHPRSLRDAEDRSQTDSTRHQTKRRRMPPVVGLALAALLALVALPGASHATDSTLRMAFGNIVNGPLDMIVSPYTGGYILVTNLRDIDDSRGVRVTYAVPGYVWLTGLEFGSGGIRTITGALESIPGVLLFPFDNDMDELFDPVGSSSAIVVDWYNPVSDNEEWYVRWNPVATFFSIPIRFGLNYTRSDY
jgi:hypothetical protein